jgi:hypothetical protein
MAALYLGGFHLNIEGGGGIQTMLGLLVTFVLYLLVWFGVRTVLRGPVGTVFSVILACLVATVLLPILTRAAFRVFGIRITRPA